MALEARLKYLSDSAHLLACSAPRTSAFLMSRCHTLLANNDVELVESHNVQVCGGCGNIMVLGVTATRNVDGSRVEKKRTSSRGKAKSKGATQPDKVVVYSCDLCGKQTLHSFTPTTIKSHSRLSHSSGGLKSIESSNAPSSAAPTISTITTIPPTAGNTSFARSNKKNVKSHKNGGLKALLAKKKEFESRGSGRGAGLDLLDLMKKG
jgi:hypothetical protein